MDSINTSSTNESFTESSVNNTISPLSTGIKRKSMEQEYACQLCSSSFVNSSNLRQHVDTIHMRSNMWSCMQCGKLFSSKSNLKVHLRVHTRVRPYHCKYCKYSCMHHSSIKEHLAKLHIDHQHSTNTPGYIYNTNAVPDPVDFNSQEFNKEAFIEEAKQANDKLSEQIASSILANTPTSINSTPDEQPRIKRQRLSKKTSKVTSTPVSHYNKDNPFSIDNLINTPTTPKTISLSFGNQNNLINSWLYANQLATWYTIQNGIYDCVSN